MLFAITDEGSLEVFADVHSANLQIEGWSVETGNVVFYHEVGRRLIPSFPFRNDSRVLGIRITNDPGSYELTVDDDADSNLLAEFDTIRYLGKNPW